MKTGTLYFAFLLAVITNSNAQWTPTNSNVSSYAPAAIIEISGVDDHVAWALPYDQTNIYNFQQDVLHTTDGGNTWVDNIATEIPNHFITGIDGIDANNAYITAWDFYNGGGKILKTSDAGIHWTQQGTAFNDAASFPDLIHFFDTNNGVAVGDPIGGYFEIYTTKDGGANWKRVSSSKIPPPQYGEFGGTYFFDALGKTIWFGTTNLRVYKSTDKGKSWSVFSTPATVNTGSAVIKFRDQSSGLFRNGSDLYKSSDGGASWSQVNYSGTFFTYDLEYIPQTVSAWISTGGDDNLPQNVAHGKGSSYSLDDGQTWIVMDTGVDRTAMDIVSAFAGYGGGISAGDGSGGMYNFTGILYAFSCNTNKYSVCFKGVTKCISANRVNSALATGAQLGSCGEMKIEDDVIYNEEATISVSPNPASDFFTVQLANPSSHIQSIQLFDITGRILKDAEHVDHSEMKIMRDGLPAGIYLLKIKTGDQEIQAKVIFE